MTETFENKRILLIISGGVAAYKSLELIRLVKKSGGKVSAILTKGGAQFITSLSVGSLTGEAVYDELWSLKDETEMGHIRLSREADLIVIAPASANLIAKMANGIADDLASTTLLAANKPILIAPAMNHMMWDNDATRENLAKLKERGIMTVGPFEGDMACDEYGMGRMAEPADIMDAIRAALFKQPLKGFKTVVTAGPTFEPLDPVRFIGNKSSGKQGYAIAAALYDLGADVTLISGPVSITPPAGMNFVQIETAAEMLKASERALPADIFIAAAAVADWTPETQSKQKIKKGKTGAPSVKLKENPDILKTIATSKKRPKLVIGFAAETENLIKNAKEKLARKGCDWILANDASNIASEENHVHLITRTSAEDWKKQSKRAIARKLAEKIAQHVGKSASKSKAAV